MKQPELLPLKKNTQKFLSGKYDGKYTTIGAAASWLSDPYYLAGYFLVDLY